MMADSMPEQLLGGLGQAVLDALPGPGGLVDADGTLIVVNGRWREAQPTAGLEDFAVAPGENVITALAQLRARLAGHEATLAVDSLLLALDRVLHGTSTREQVSIAHLRGWDGLTQFTFSRLPEP